MNQQQAKEALNNQVTSFYNGKLFEQNTCEDMIVLANLEILGINNILNMGINEQDRESLTAYQEDCLLALITDISDYYA